MSFNLEDLLQFINLNPELQAKFTDMEAKITELENYIKQFGIINDARLSRLCYNALNGQVVKIDAPNQSLFADDNFRNIKVVSTNEELAAEMGYKQINLKDVFNTWYRFTQDTRYLPAKQYFWKNFILDDPNDTVTYYSSAGEDYQNNSKDDSYKAAWTYDDLTKTIQNNGNVPTLTGFISLTKYWEYWIEFTIKSNQAMHSGEDYCGVVIAWMKDNNGVEHTLSLVRGNNSVSFANGAMDYVKFSLVYDMYQRTFQNIYNVTDNITDTANFCQNSNNGQKCNLYVAKYNNSIIAKTTNYSDSDPGEKWVENANIEWHFPKTKPDEWTDSCWANMQNMMKNPMPMGLWALSYSSNFYIKGQQEIFDDDKIYSLHTDEVYEYDVGSTSWIVTDKVHNVLPNRLFLYNKRLHHLFFYSYWNKYIRIDT